MKLFKKLGLAVIAVVFAILSLSGAFAYYYNYQDPSYGYPMYQSGYYYSPYVYGFSGWDYNRVNYYYHYPYSTYGYNSYYPPGTWVGHYDYFLYPTYYHYPWNGYYW